MTKGQRQTKIVATVGPASACEERLQALMLAGVDVFRLNFSHGTSREHAETCSAVRRLAERHGKAVAVLAHLQGPKIRTGRLRQGRSVNVQTGAGFVITSRDIEGDDREVGVSYHDLPRYVEPGQRLLLDDGRLELRVVAVTETEVQCQVLQGDLLGEHKGINLPNITVDIPPFTEKDREDLELSIALGVDYIAMSFVQQADDVRHIREVLRARGARTPVIAKIEKPQALENLDAILRAFDGVLVARGDLGVETSPEEVPPLQKHIIHRANEAGKLVIKVDPISWTALGQCYK